MSSTDDDSELRVNLETNRLYYREWRREVRNYAFRHGLSCDVEVDKGLFGVTLRVRMSGDRDRVQGFLRALKANPHYDGCPPP